MYIYIYIWYVFIIQWVILSMFWYILYRYLKSNKSNIIWLITNTGQGLIFTAPCELTEQRESNFEDHLATPRATCCRLWLKLSPNVKLCKLNGNATFPRLLLNCLAKVKFCRLGGHVTESKDWLKPPRVKLWRFTGKFLSGSVWGCKRQAYETRKSHTCWAIVTSETQALKETRQCDKFQTGEMSKTQVLEALWQRHAAEFLLEIRTKSKMSTKSQTFKTTWQCHIL